MFNFFPKACLTALSAWGLVAGLALLDHAVGLVGLVPGAFAAFCWGGCMGWLWTREEG